MSLNKLTYEYHTTPVSSQNLNDIQDAVISLEASPTITNDQETFTDGAGQTSTIYRMCEEFPNGFKIQHVYMTTHLATTEWSSWGSLYSSANLMNPLLSWKNRFTETPWMIAHCLHKNCWCTGPMAANTDSLGTDLYVITANQPSSVVTLSIHIVGFGR